MIKTLTFHPSRIGCPSIPGTVKGILMSIPGVLDTHIHYKERSIDVHFDDERVHEDDITKKIGDEMGLAFTANPLHADVDTNVDDTTTNTCPM